MKSFLGNQFNFADILTSKFFLIEFLSFIPLYILNIYLAWPQIYLLLFPLILFCFGLFFVGIYFGKDQIQIPLEPITINPYGDEFFLSKIFFGCSIMLNVILTLFGVDTLYYPQLVDNYGIFFLIPIIIIYHTIWFWIPWNIFFKSYLKINKISKLNKESQEYQSKQDEKIILQKLSNKQIKKYVIRNLVIFIALLGWFFIENMVILTLNTGMWIQKIAVPGTLIPYSEYVSISGTIWIILIVDPILFVIEYTLIVNHIISKKQIQKDKLLNNIKDLPELEKRYILKSLEYL